MVLYYLFGEESIPFEAYYRYCGQIMDISSKIAQKSQIAEMVCMLNSTPEDRIIALFKFKVFADDNRSVVQMVHFFLKGKKTWEMEKMLLTSIFFFSYKFFQLTLSQTSPGFYVSAI